MDFSIEAALRTLESWGSSFIAMLPNIVVSILIVLFFYFLGKGVRNLVLRTTQKKEKSQSVGIVIGRFAFGLSLLTGFFVAMTVLIPSFTAGELVSTLGITSIAIGFAFKDILQNFLAGILILLTEPFRIDDQIQVNGYEGTVVNIETRATKIRTYDNRLVVIPNASMFSESVTVNTAYEVRRSEFDFGIGYDDDIDQAKKIIMEVLQATEWVADSPAPETFTVGLGDSSVAIRGRWWTKPEIGPVTEATDAIVTTVKKRFDAAGITIPFPIRTVYMKKDA